MKCLQYDKLEMDYAVSRADAWADLVIVPWISFALSDSDFFGKTKYVLVSILKVIIQPYYQHRARHTVVIQYLLTCLEQTLLILFCADAQSSKVL